MTERLGLTVANVYAKIAALRQAGHPVAPYEYSTLTHAVLVAEAFAESCRRRQHLPWSFHQDVAALPPATCSDPRKWRRP